MPDEIRLTEGAVTFSRDRLDLHAGKVTLRARTVTERSPDGAVHLRLASPIEDELLDRLLAAESGPGRRVHSTAEVREAMSRAGCFADADQNQTLFGGGPDAVAARLARSLARRDLEGRPVAGGEASDD